jgi:hypothetical protein
MQSKKFDHTLTLKITRGMVEEIDRALVLLETTFVDSRSEFLRAAAQYALNSLKYDSAGDDGQSDYRDN